MAATPLGERADFRRLVDRLEGVTVWLVSEPGSFDYVSDGFESIFGISPSRVEADPQALLDRIHPGDRERVAALMAQTEDKIAELSYESRIVRPDGSIRWVQTRQFPIRDEDGAFEVLVGVNTDITAQKRREEELEVLNRVLRHDVRNDMNVILGWAQLLRDADEPPAREQLEAIIEAGRHVVELTEGAREYVEMLEGGEEPSLHPVSLRDVLEHEVRLRRASYPGATIHLEGPLPDVEVPATELLSAVFRNLIGNAVEHNDGPDPVVEVDAERRDGTVVIQVADNGPGIPPDRREAIFGKGERGLDSPGTGIGLYLVSRLVEGYGGSVRVGENDPRGTVFVVELPVAD